MKPLFASQSYNRGIVSFAVLIFFVAILAVAVAAFMTMSAVSISLRSFDTVRFETIEKNGVAQLVAQSIIATRGTVVTHSTLSVEQEITARLSALNLAPGVTLSLASSQPLPTHTFYPAVTPPTITPQTSLVGYGRRLAPFLEAFNQAHLGQVVYTFNRTVNNAPTDNRTYRITADLFSVPITNLSVVAYGLPNSLGTFPSAAPVSPNVLPATARRLVMTSNNPANDPTAYADLYPGTTPEQWPAQYEPTALWCWDAYEYIWSATYQNALLASALPGATYDFSTATHSSIAGLSTTSTAVTIDLAVVTASTLAVVDSQGIGLINIVGSNASGPAFMLLLKNTAASPTTVHFTGDNQRPFLLMAQNCALSFSGNPSMNGAFILDRQCTGTGAATLFGHLSYYAGSALFPAWNLTVNGSPGYESSYSTVAPRVLLVSTRGIR